jgi:Zn-dependent protease
MLFRIPALLLAVTVHEFMHGKIAHLYGDSTAKDQGRLSLNPLKHLDPLGTLMIIVAGFGWAKPVPVNPNRFQDPRKQMMLVGLAGPLANFTAAFLLARLFYLPMPEVLSTLLGVTIWINVMLGIFNLLPIPPLDGSKIIPYFLPESMQDGWYSFEKYGFVILLALVFLIPGFLGTVLNPPIEYMLRFVYAGLPA